MISQYKIEIEEAVPLFEYAQFKSPINWNISAGKCWIIIGSNGSGKSLLIDVLLKRLTLESGRIVCETTAGEALAISEIVKSVSFKDIYSIVDTQNSYYQQRWNRGIEQNIPVVKDLFADKDVVQLENLLDYFKIRDLLDKELSLLSSGELRKFLIIRTLLTNPKVLILDNPFIGLDIASRRVLNDLLVHLSELNNIRLIFVVSDPADIPEIVTDVLPIKDKCLYPSLKIEDFLGNKSLFDELFSFKANIDIAFLKTSSLSNVLPFENVAVLNNVEVKYGSRTILKDINWSLKRGDKWALLGPNGSGKSTLLSLIYGDNPQAYANDIVLFDRKRGTGESIWDIKKRIGYISPEMHLYYLKNVDCLDIVASGFFDTIGLYSKYNKEQERIALQWLEVFGVIHLVSRRFLSLSSGEQRLILLARLFVKNPDLLILDEPMHGLDVVNKLLVKRIIEDFCIENKTLIYVTHYDEEIPACVDQKLILTKLK